MRQTLASPGRVVAECSSRALLSNYQAIREQVLEHGILPMIKANAYGHGVAWVARQLLGQPGLYGFGVATLEEGAQLRQELGVRATRLRIIVFSGALPWSEEVGRFCLRNHLTPVIASDLAWKSFYAQGWHRRLNYELKFNTGMNRLGIDPELAPKIAQVLRKQPASAHPSGVLTHLAMAESPDAPLSLSQRERFEILRAELAGALPSTLFHVANSSAIWHAKSWRLRGLTDLVRPGLSLYGVPPWAGAPKRGIVPVMTLKSKIALIREVPSGESVGYGGTFVVPNSRSKSVAILGAGYADGIHRAGSGRARLWLRGKSVGLLGRVSMDMVAVECPRGAKAGEYAEWAGPHLDPWVQAASMGTIPYEVLTSVGARVQRIYV